VPPGFNECQISPLILELRQIYNSAVLEHNTESLPDLLPRRWR
jgi:hypothetical protein